METLVHRARRLGPGMAAMALALLYLAVSTQLAFPLGDMIGAAAATESVVQKESLAAKGDFACALHQCGCKNAEQCRTRCCCFPKTSRTHSSEGGHGHAEGRGEDHMTHYQACNGPGGHDHGLPPSLSAHLLPRPALLPDAAPTLDRLASVSARLPSPVSEAPQKIPI